MTRHAVLENSELAALQWYLDHGVDEVLENQPVDRTQPAVVPINKPVFSATATPQNKTDEIRKLPQATEEPLGTAQAIVEARNIVATVETLDQLQEAINAFEGLSVKKTASNMVFSDGNPEANIMVIGEAPGRDEDIQGKPFVGTSGQLLDKIFAAIDLSRDAKTAEQSIYISNILNWRPPGNRTPTDAEINIARPFIEKHISLVKPKIIVMCGAVAAKGLLQQTQSISKMRKIFHEYKTPDGYQALAMATYHPAYLLRTPSQKRAVWQDMLMLQEKLRG